MGIMLVYDITNEKSFDNIVKWLRNIDEHANEDVEKMILGNKCDMQEKRVVAKERGEAVSVAINKLIHGPIYLIPSPSPDREGARDQVHGDISQSQH